MLRKAAFWSGAVVLVGFPSLLAGITILANVTDTDHRYGWALLVFGIACIVVGGIAYSLLPIGGGTGERKATARADTGGIASTGNVASRGQRGGQTANVIFNVQHEADKGDESITPVLEFSEASSEQVTLYDDGRPVTNAILWRVELNNVVDGTKAVNVSVQLARSTPVLPVLPVDIHKFHDDTRPYKRSHEIRYGEPLILDVFAKQVGADEFFLWRSDLPQGYAYVYQLSPPEKAAIIDSLLGGGLIVTLKAVPDPPAKLAERAYRVFIDDEGRFVTTRI